MAEDEAAAGPDDGGHILPEQLYALAWALKQDPPPTGDEDREQELGRAIRALPAGFDAEFPHALRLGPETVQRLLAHSKTCDPCHVILVEDAADAKRPQTEGEVKSDFARAEALRKEKVIRFWVGVTVGTTSFVGANYVFHLWKENRSEQVTESETGTMQTKQGFQLDPYFMGGVMLVFVAAYFLAEAYTIARDLWIDFTSWKRAVPLIGKRWVERDKAKR
jgi:hypothetical protein